MSIFDKFKKSVSDAGALAKVTVEVNRLKLQIAAKKKEIATLHASIGETVFHAYATKDETDVRAKVEGYCSAIVELQKEIEDIALKIRELGNEKTCKCGNAVALDAKFCPTCGEKFEAKEPAAEEAAAAAEQAGDAGGESEPSSCPSCGGEADSDAKFCGHCGHTL